MRIAGHRLKIKNKNKDEFPLTFFQNSYFIFLFLKDLPFVFRAFFACIVAVNNLKPVFLKISGCLEYYNWNEIHLQYEIPATLGV